MMLTSLDVHGLNVEQAKKVIQKAINEAYNTYQSSIKINHGFNKGNKIKSWCLQEGPSCMHVEKVETGSNEGISIFYLKINIKR